MVYFKLHWSTVKILWSQLYIYILYIKHDTTMVFWYNHGILDMSWKDHGVNQITTVLHGYH